MQSMPGAIRQLSPGHAAGLQARILNASSPWMAMDNTFGAVWEANNFPEPPLDLRVTNSVGEKVGTTSNH
jgi:hypothetical protein